MEQNTSPTDYRALSADALLDILEHAGRTPDLELLRVCLERRPELTPTLLEWLARPDDPAWPDDDPRYMAQIHAGLLLCAYREPAALPIFERLYREEEVYPETLADWFDPALPSYGPLALPMLVKLLDDPSVPDFNRSTALGILVTIATRHPEVHTQVVEQIRALLPPLAPDTGDPQVSSAERRRPPLLWTWAMEGLADLRDLQSQKQILALFSRGLIHERMAGGKKEYLHHLNRPQTSTDHWLISEPFDLLEKYAQLHRQALREAELRATTAEARAQLAAQRKRLDEQHSVTNKILSAEATSQPPKTPDWTLPLPQPTVTRTQPKIGRNEPCPCGSGRKYKHCHGK